MLKKETGLILVFGFIFIFSIAMILIQNLPSTDVSLTGFATTGTAVSNVTISKYLSISMSSNLSGGILFGSIDTLPAVNLNASGNNNSGGSSSFLINVSSDSNTAVDFCLKANADLYDSTGGNTLAIGNESYANATTTSASIPVLSQEVSFTTSYVKAGEGIGIGNGSYYRFWLDIPSGTASGTYNNTISFEGVETGTSC